MNLAILKGVPVVALNLLRRRAQGPPWRCQYLVTRKVHVRQIGITPY